MAALFEGRTSRYTCLALPARRSIDFRAMASPIPILLQSVATAMDAMWPLPLRTSAIRYPTTLPSLRATVNPSPTLSLNHTKTILGYGSGKEAFSITIIWSRSSYSKVPILKSLNRVRLLGSGVRRLRQRWEDQALELVRGRAVHSPSPCKGGGRLGGSRKKIASK